MFCPCNIHSTTQCSAFIPRIVNASDGDIDCDLFSDIALLDECPENETKTSVHVSLSYRHRDALVEARDQCFINFEDTAEIG